MKMYYNKIKDQLANILCALFVLSILPMMFGTCFIIGKALGY